jgi:BatD DUF11 like domain
MQGIFNQQLTTFAICHIIVPLHLHHKYMKKFLALTLFCLMLTAYYSKAQVNFAIKTSAKEIGKEDVLQVEYEVSGTTDAENFITPIFNNWKIISGPATSSQSSNINGRVSQSISFVFVLQPTTTGFLRLPAASATVNGKKINCSGIAIKVLTNKHVAGASSSQNNGLQFGNDILPQRKSYNEEFARASLLSKGETPEQKMKGNIFIKAMPNKTSFVVGEPILVNYKLYTRLLNNSVSMLHQPTFSGCSVNEMTTDDLQPSVEEVNGKLYKSFYIRKVQLFPLQAGDLILDSTAIETNITFYKSSGNGYLDQPITVTKTITSPLVTLRISALPEKNKPESFTGAVGKFVIKADVLKRKDTVNENNTLYISIEGLGNFRNVFCPNVQWSNNADHFETKTSEFIDKLSFPVEGKKVFAIPFVAKKEGVLLIPKIMFSYYDVASQQYKTISTDSINIQVGAAVNKNVDESKLTGDVTNRQYLLFIPAIALFVIIGLWLMYGRKENVKQKNTEQGNVAVEEELHTNETNTIIPAEEINSTEELNKLLLLENDEDFFTAVKTFASKLFVNDNDINKKRAIEQLTNDCNEALYSPVAKISKDEVLRKLEILVK